MRTPPWCDRGLTHSATGAAKSDLIGSKLLRRANMHYDVTKYRNDPKFSDRYM